MRLLLLLVAMAAPAQVYLHVQFDHAPDQRALLAMQNEVMRLTAGIAVRFEDDAAHLLIDESDGGPGIYRAAPAPPDRVVSLQFFGVCSADGLRHAALVNDDLAWTHTDSGGAVIPFVAVECDRLRDFLPATDASVYGRALGRLVAHELYHAITRSKRHGRGLMAARLRAEELTGAVLPFDRRDRARLAAACE